MASWRTRFRCSNPIGSVNAKQGRLDATSIHLGDIDAIAQSPTLDVLCDTPVEWLYGGLLHACVDLLCHAATYESVRPLLSLVLSITSTVERRFMLRTVNYYGEMPVHIITDRTAGRANTSYILYRMCMPYSERYIQAIREAWIRIRTHAHRRVHERAFRTCLDAVCAPRFRSFGALC